MYKYYNANPRGRYVDDCTVRSISVAEELSWDRTYEKLSTLAQEKRMMMDSVEFIEDYLDERYERFCPDSVTVGEFIEQYPYGTYILSMPGHLTVIKDGINYDTFSTLSREIWCSWFVE